MPELHLGSLFTRKGRRDVEVIGGFNDAGDPIAYSTSVIRGKRLRARRFQVLIGASNTIGKDERKQIRSVRKRPVSLMLFLRGLKRHMRKNPDLAPLEGQITQGFQSRWGSKM